MSDADGNLTRCSPGQAQQELLRPPQVGTGGRDEHGEAREGGVRRPQQRGLGVNWARRHGYRSLGYDSDSKPEV